MPGTITPIGVNTPQRYTRLATAGSGPNMLVDPGNANAPIIFEPPPALSGGDLEVWLIASGGDVQVATSAATASGATLHFTGPLPPSVVAGVVVEDLTSPGAIPAGTTVQTPSPTAPVLSAAVTGGGVGSGDTIAFYNPNWGGAQIWVSTDGNTYALAGQIYRGGRQGVLTASLPSHADPDTSDTLSVDLAMSQGQLLSGTSANANDFVTLCYCDGELVSYETPLGARPSERQGRAVPWSTKPIDASLPLPGVARPRVARPRVARPRVARCARPASLAVAEAVPAYPASGQLGQPPAALAGPRWRPLRRFWLAPPRRPQPATHALAGPRRRQARVAPCPGRAGLRGRRPGARRSEAAARRLTATGYRHLR